MKKISLLLVMLVVTAALAAPAAATTAVSGISANEALRVLKEGNARYVDGKLQHPHQGPGAPGPDLGPGPAPPGRGPHLLRLPGAAGDHLRPGHRRYFRDPGGRQRRGHG